MEEKDKVLFAKMHETLNHFGGYGVKSCRTGPAALGQIRTQGRLAEQAPLWSADGRYCFFFDGFLYEFDRAQKRIGTDNRPRSQSAAELALALFEEYGEDCVQYLQGIFVLAVFDTLEETLFLINDRYGYRYLYYVDTPRKFLFAPEIKALLCSGLISKRMNEEAACDLINFHFITGDKTLFRDILLLPPATVLRIRGSEVRFRRYWNYVPDPRLLKGSLEELTHQAYGILKRAFGEFLKNRQGRIGISISGGLDSRMIFALATEYERNVPLLHYGICSKKETAIARKISRIHGSSFTYYEPSADILSEMERGIEFSDGDISADQCLFLNFAQKVSLDGQIDVLLHGLGMDRLFHCLAGAEDDFRKRIGVDAKVGMLRREFMMTPPYLYSTVLRKDFAPSASPDGRLRQYALEFPCEDLQAFYEYFYFRNRCRRYIQGMLKVNEIYTAYMFPGMNYDLFDFITLVPRSVRQEGKLYRSIFCKYYPELARVPYNWTMLPLDRWDSPVSRLRYKMRRSYYYVGRLSGGRLNFYLPREDPDRQYRERRYVRHGVETVLLDKRIDRRPYYSREGIRTLLELERSGRNYMALILSIFQLELFLRKYMD